MYQLQVTLEIGGQSRIFRTDEIPMRCSVEAYRLLAEGEAYGGAYPDDYIERMARMVSRLFDDQFTPDELMNHCRDSFFRMVPPMLRAVVEGVSEAIRSFPARPTKAATTTERTTT